MTSENTSNRHYNFIESSAQKVTPDGKVTEINFQYDLDSKDRDFPYLDALLHQLQENKPGDYSIINPQKNPFIADLDRQSTDPSSPMPLNKAIDALIKIMETDKYASDDMLTLTVHEEAGKSRVMPDAITHIDELRDGTIQNATLSWSNRIGVEVRNGELLAITDGKEDYIPENVMEEAKTYAKDNKVNVNVVPYTIADINNNDDDKPHYDSRTNYVFANDQAKILKVVDVKPLPVEENKQTIQAQDTVENPPPATRPAPEAQKYPSNTGMADLGSGVQVGVDRTTEPGKTILDTIGVKFIPDRMLDHPPEPTPEAQTIQAQDTVDTPPPPPKPTLNEVSEITGLTKLEEMDASKTHGEFMVAYHGDTLTARDFSPQAQYIQNAMNQCLGKHPEFHIPKVKENGLWDQNCVKQCIEIQKKLGIEPTGVADQNFAYKLEKELGLHQTVPKPLEASLKGNPDTPDPNKGAPGITPGSRM